MVFNFALATCKECILIPAFAPFFMIAAIDKQSKISYIKYINPALMDRPRLLDATIMFFYCTVSNIAEFFHMPISAHVTYHVSNDNAPLNLTYENGVIKALQCTIEEISARRCVSM